MSVNWIADEVEQLFSTLKHSPSSVTKPSTFRMKDCNWPSLCNLCRAFSPELVISPLALNISERSTLLVTKKFNRQSATLLLTLPLTFNVRLDNSEVCSKRSPRMSTLWILNSPLKFKVKVFFERPTLEIGLRRENEASSNLPFVFGWSVRDFQDFAAANVWILSTTPVQHSGTSPRTFNTREYKVLLIWKPFASEAAPWLLRVPLMTAVKEFKVVSSDSPSLKAQAKKSSMSPKRVNEKEISDLLEINSLKAWAAVLSGTP